MSSLTTLQGSFSVSSMKTKYRRPRRTLCLLLAYAVTGWGLIGCGGGSADIDSYLKTPDPYSLSYAQYCRLPAATANAPTLPEPTGRVCLGKASYQVIDTKRSQENADGKSGPRELSIKVWYPIAAADGGKRADYLNPVISAMINKVIGITADTSTMQTHAKAGAVALTASAYPVVLLSPGHGAVVEHYSALAEDLASRGVVVVGVDHPYISGPTLLSNGQVAQIKESSAQTEEEGLAISIAEQATLTADLRSVLDWLQTPGRLATRLDFSRVGAFGHSYGGGAALLIGRSDARVQAALNMDGSVFDLVYDKDKEGNPVIVSGGVWPKPLLFLQSAQSDGTDMSVEAVLKGATSSKGSIVIAGSGHNDFGDFKLLLNFYAPKTTNKELEEWNLGSASAPKILGTVRSEVWNFFRQHLRL